MPGEAAEERETGTGRVQGDEGRLIKRWGGTKQAREKKYIWEEREGCLILIEKEKKKNRQLIICSFPSRKLISSLLQFFFSSPPPISSLC